MLRSPGFPGLLLYRYINNRTLRGVPQAAALRDKIVLTLVEKLFYAHIAGFRQQDCNRLVLDEPITCNQRLLRSIRYQRHLGELDSICRVK